MLDWSQGRKDLIIFISMVLLTFHKKLHVNIRGQCLKSYNSLEIPFWEICSVACVQLGRESLKGHICIFSEVFFFPRWPFSTSLYVYKYNNIFLSNLLFFSIVKIYFSFKFLNFQFLNWNVVDIQFILLSSVQHSDFVFLYYAVDHPNKSSNHLTSYKVIARLLQYSDFIQ